MTMADAAEKRMTVAEFLDWDDGTDTRYELIDGRPVAMAPVAPSHSIIVVNLGRELKSRLKAALLRRQSRPASTRPDRDDTFYEADVVVSCTPLERRHDGHPRSRRGDRGALALDPRARSRAQGLRLPSDRIGAGDRAGVERAAPRGDLATPRREVGGRGPDRRRRARARGRRHLDPAAPRSTPTAACSPTACR